MRRALVLLLLLSGCVAPTVSKGRAHFLNGMAFRESRPRRAAEEFRAARQYVNIVLAEEHTPAEEIEALGILARIELEHGQYEAAEAYIARGAVFFEDNSPHRTWVGDAGAIHLMKGDHFIGRATAVLESYGGEARNSKEAAVLVHDYHLGMIEFLLAEDKAVKDVRSFIRLRLVRASTELSRVWRAEKAFHDTVYRNAARKALVTALDRCRKEMETPGRFYEEFRKLRKPVEEQLEILKKIEDD